MVNIALDTLDQTLKKTQDDLKQAKVDIFELGRQKNDQMKKYEKKIEDLNKEWKQMTEDLNKEWTQKTKDLNK